MMVPKIKKARLKLLRSGKYKQTKGVLYAKKGDRARFANNNIVEGGMCCLGVLMCAQGKERYLRRELGECNVSVVPAALAAGLTICQQRTLAKMNDNFGKNFNEIADYVEKNL